MTPSVAVKSSCATGRKEIPMNSEEGSLSELCKNGQLEQALQSYIESCSTIPDNGAETSKKSDAKKQSSKFCFPNLAGFCRYLGVGTQDLENMANEHPSEYGRILTVLEDEALNSGLSATLLSAYLKKRLGYDTPSKNTGASTQLEICFEHDIMEDGG